MSRLKQLSIPLVLILLCGLIVAPSFLIPWWQGSDVPSPKEIESSYNDAQYIDILKEAWRLEREGKLKEALAQYKAAFKSQSLRVRGAANTGAQRVDLKLRLPFALSDDLELMRDVSTKARPAIIAAILIYMMYWLAAWVYRLTLSPGWAIRAFPVFASSDTSAGSSFTLSLLDWLAAIQWFYQRPSEDMDRIGAKVTIPNLMPEEHGANPLADALGSLREAQGKNLQVFFLAEVLRFMSSFRQRRRYVLSGSVELLPQEARVLAQLRDSRTGAVLGRLEASTREVEYLQREPSLMPPALRQTIAVSNGMPGIEPLLAQVNLVDNRENQKRLSDLAELLAYKIWYTLSEGARAAFQPVSWQTVCHFIRGLKALKQNQLDPADAATQKEAIASLRTIVEQIDPLYRPARFFLGFAYLSCGDWQDAQFHFEKLMEPVEKAAGAFLDSIEKDWHTQKLHLKLFRLMLFVKKQLPRLGPPGRWLAAHIPSFQEWLESCEDVFILLHGSKWYWLAKQWSEFPEQFQDWESAQKHNNEVGRLRFSLYVDLFRAEPEIQRLVKVAAGLETGEISREKAQDFLDRYLNQRSITQLYSTLTLLDFQASSAELVDTLDAWKANRGVGNGSHADERYKEQLDKIDNLIKCLEGCTKEYKEILTTLRQRWEMKNWAECHRLIRDMRRETQAPDKEEARKLIASLELPAKWRWLVKHTLPIFGEVQRWRNSFVKDRLYLESRYYLNMAKYQSFEDTKLREVVTDARELHTRLLSDSRSSSLEQARLQELHTLFICLEVDAAVRILSALENDKRITDPVESRLSEIVKEIKPQLKEFAQHGSRDVAAAAYSTLGLLQRYKKLSTDWSLRGVTSDFEEDEVRCFAQSLELRASANTYTYLAESLVSSQQHQEACQLLAQALRRCPRHSLALALQQQWGSPERP